MNRKLLGRAVIVLAVTLSAPLAQAGDRYERDGDRRVHYRGHYVERDYHHPGWRHGHQWKHHHRHHHRPRHIERHYYHPAPRYESYREYPQYRHHRSSSAPILLGSVIGGVVGHEIGYGDPGHTAVGAVLGTVIGYEIARHR